MKMILLIANVLSLVFCLLLMAPRSSARVIASLLCEESGDVVYRKSPTWAGRCYHGSSSGAIGCTNTQFFRGLDWEDFGYLYVQLCHASGYTHLDLCYWNEAMQWRQSYNGCGNGKEGWVTIVHDAQPLNGRRRRLGEPKGDEMELDPFDGVEGDELEVKIDGEVYTILRNPTPPDDEVEPEDSDEDDGGDE